MMYRLNNNKKENNVVETTATAVLIAATIAASPLLQQQLVDGKAFLPSNFAKAPIAISGDNIYIAWWTNNTANNNEEVMFRASNDGGATFGDKINLSNTTDADSTRVEIAGEGDNVIVSWWETNQTSDIPVARVSTDGGETFGPKLRLGANGTLTNTEGGADGGGETTTEDEAVGGAEVAE
jgi:hypothetical protein